MLLIVTGSLRIQIKSRPFENFQWSFVRNFSRRWKTWGFLGLASWYCRFIEKFATITMPLQHLRKKNTRWSWDPEQETAFNELKHRLCSARILACPDFNHEFTLQVDASNFSLGASGDDPSARWLGSGDSLCGCRLLTEAELNYSTTEKECLALVWAMCKFNPYLEGYHFTVVTDHIPGYVQQMDRASTYRICNHQKHQRKISRAFIEILSSGNHHNWQRNPIRIEEFQVIGWGMGYSPSYDCSLQSPVQSCWTAK